MGMLDFAPAVFALGLVTPVAHAAETPNNIADGDRARLRRRQ